MPNRRGDFSGAGFCGGLCRVAPPSVLPDISPSRGEIDSRLALRQTMVAGTSASAHLISPLEGEMPGRAEGGAKYSNPASYPRPASARIFCLSIFATLRVLL